MSRRWLATLALVCPMLMASTVFGLGADYSKAELEVRGELVKGQHPVHGFWVNESDVFFYSGDTAAFNAFVASYARLERRQLKVVIHAGTKNARSPWDKEDRDIPADWSLYLLNDAGEPTKSTPSHVDVWLGSRIKIEDLKIPLNVEVVSGGEIETFVSERVPPKPESQEKSDKK